MLRQKHSTEITLSELEEDLVEIFDSLFIDLKKTFHSIEHKILLSKLELHGIERQKIHVVFFISTK